MPDDCADLESLKLTRSQLIANIAAITARPKPTYNIDGQEVKWTEYLAELRKQLLGINDLITSMEGSFEIETQGYC